MGNLTVVGHTQAMSENQKELIDPVAIGARLAQMRTALGANQKMLSELVGCVPSSWHNYERGKQLLPVQYAALLSERYGVPLDWLYLGRKALLPYNIAQSIEKTEREAHGQPPSRAPILKRRQA